MDERPQEARIALVAIKAASHDALGDLRAILGVLRDTDDAASRRPAAGLAQLGELVESVRRAGVEVDLRLDLGSSPLPAALDLTAFRVVQEALTNVVRHAPGAAAAVSVQRGPDSLSVAIESDRGRPDALNGEGRKGSGHGLEGMRERVRAAGGSLEAAEVPKGGFAVRATLPLEVR
jgi:signal transduction histidine kinase